MRRISSVAACTVIAMLVTGCGSNGYNGHHGSHVEESFAPRTAEEIEAQARMRQAIQVAETLLEDPELPDEKRARQRLAARRARSALADYDTLRSRGSTRAVIIAGVRASAVAIVADDATGVGVADDALLVPLALGAIATYIFTKPDASAGDLARGWNRVAQHIQELATTVDDILVMMTARGRVADTGIMAEVYKLLGEWRMSPDKNTICRALAALYQEAKDANDVDRMGRIFTTQKAKKCRPSRHTRDR